MSIEAMRQMVAALEDIKDDCAGCEFEWQNDYPVQCAALEAGRKALAEADEKMRELCAHHNKIGYKQGYRAGRADEREACCGPEILNAAGILASDMPHTVVEKYRAAIRAGGQR